MKIDTAAVPSEWNDHTNFSLPELFLVESLVTGTVCHLSSVCLSSLSLCNACIVTKPYVVEAGDGTVG